MARQLKLAVQSLVRNEKESDAPRAAEDRGGRTAHFRENLDSNAGVTQAGRPPTVAPGVQAGHARPSYARAVAPSASTRRVANQGDRSLDGRGRSRGDGRLPTAAERVVHLQRQLASDRKEFDRRISEVQNEAHNQYSYMLHKLQLAERANLQLLEENQRMHTLVQTEHDRATHIDKEYAEARLLLDARTAELASVQVFIGPGDTLSERDVVKRLEELNEEIFQLSALMSDNVEFTTADACVERARKSVSKRLGQRVCDALAVEGESVRLGMLQLALQAAAGRWSHRMALQWTSLDGQLDDQIQDLYKIICADEGLTVAKRWQAITQKGLFKDDQEDIASFNSSLHATLRDVLVVARCEPKTGDGDVALAISEGIQSIVSTTLQLRHDASLGVASTELVTILPRPGKPYDRSKMLADVSGQQNNSDDIVGCGISMGLVRLVDAGLQEYTLVKPKVVLATALESVYVAQ
ncbi:hypothetical protein BD626DRAFT_568406 [Schizophyllum amplum]|uniref:Uncharacterized protein n=1 Tax=Schizophyllum amplum TaxID=97359 RepID=A0A550CG51_9AGAR|nr:hypothetical protein BD626DRAFT_568406 [Auriculariopsis ampla]